MGESKNMDVLVRDINPADKNSSITLEGQANMLQEYIDSNNELIQVTAEK